MRSLPADAAAAAAGVSEGALRPLPTTEDAFEVEPSPALAGVVVEAFAAGAVGADPSAPAVAEGVEDAMPEDSAAPERSGPTLPE